GVPPTLPFPLNSARRWRYTESSREGADVPPTYGERSTGRCPRVREPAAVPGEPARVPAYVREQRWTALDRKKHRRTGGLPACKRHRAASNPNADLPVRSPLRHNERARKPA